MSEPRALSARWTYLFVYDPEEIGPGAAVRAFLDSRREIVNWHRVFPNGYLLVSDALAVRLTELFLAFTGKRGRFIILDVGPGTDVGGWLPKRYWDQIHKPKAVWEWEE